MRLWGRKRTELDSGHSSYKHTAIRCLLNSIACRMRQGSASINFTTPTVLGNVRPLRPARYQFDYAPAPGRWRIGGLQRHAYRVRAARQPRGHDVLADYPRQHCALATESPQQRPRRTHLIRVDGDIAITRSAGRSSSMAGGVTKDEARRTMTSASARTVNAAGVLLHILQVLPGIRSPDR